MIEQILRAYALEYPLDKWAQQLPFVEICINAHLSNNSGQSANKLTFSQRLMEPLGLVAGIGYEAPATTEVARVVMISIGLVVYHRGTIKAKGLLRYALTCL